MLFPQQDPGYEKHEGNDTWISAVSGIIIAMCEKRGEIIAPDFYKIAGSRSQVFKFLF
jgi:hypothetical protein